MENMTKGEIEQTLTMRDVTGRYGFYPNRKGFIKCPFHKGDKNASLKLYKTSFYCFGCGAGGDMFKFVQRMDDCSFKEAFLSLGGTYEKPTAASKLSVYHARKSRKTAQNRETRVQYDKDLCNDLIILYRRYFRASEPMSDVWIDSYNALQLQLYILYEICNEEVLS